MSYTPENQNIEDPLETIVKSIREFNSAVDERIFGSEAWTEDHLEEINKLRLALVSLLPQIKKTLG